jgi:phage terminase Nu1 subunit (DNA packaging protein)
MQFERLTYQELATLLRIQPCTVRSWMRLGCPYIPCGRLRFYSLAAVQQWLNAREAKKQEVRTARQQQEQHVAA